MYVCMYVCTYVIFVLALYLLAFCRWALSKCAKLRAATFEVCVCVCVRACVRVGVCMYVHICMYE
jgi:hypothetical protein